MTDVILPWEWPGSRPELERLIMQLEDAGVGPDTERPGQGICDLATQVVRQFIEADPARAPWHVVVTGFGPSAGLVERLIAATWALSTRRTVSYEGVECLADIDAVAGEEGVADALDAMASAGLLVLRDAGVVTGWKRAVWRDALYRPLCERAKRRAPVLAVVMCDLAKFLDATGAARDVTAFLDLALLEAQTPATRGLLMSCSEFSTLDTGDSGVLERVRRMSGYRV